MFTWLWPGSCSSLGSEPPFQRLLRLRRLKLGGASLEELRRGDLAGVTHLEELTVHANNLQRSGIHIPQFLLSPQNHGSTCPTCVCRYEPGALASIWPLGGVVLSLHGPFLTDRNVASSLLGDVSYPETPITLQDLDLTHNQSVQNLGAAARKRIRSGLSTFLDGVHLLPPERCPLQIPDLPEPVLVRRGHRGAPAGAGRGPADPLINGGRHPGGRGQVGASR